MDCSNLISSLATLFKPDCQGDILLQVAVTHLSVQSIYLLRSQACLAKLEQQTRVSSWSWSALARYQKQPCPRRLIKQGAFVPKLVLLKSDLSHPHLPPRHRRQRPCRHRRSQIGWKLGPLACQLWPVQIVSINRVH